MRIRDHLLIMVLICALGGVASTFSLAKMYRNLDVQQHQVGADSLALSSLERLRDGVDRLLVTTDLAIGGGETYLLAGAQKQVDQLLALTETLRVETLLQGSREDLETLKGAFQSVAGQIELAGTLGDGESDGLADRILEAYDANSMVVIEAVEEIVEATTERSEVTQHGLQEARSSVHRLVWGCMLVYVLLVAGVWQWIWVKVVRPLQRLTDAAHHSMIDDKAFVFEDRGPRETRLLGRTVRQFVVSLELKVADRTEQLWDQTVRLKKEISEREKAQQETQEAESRLRQAQKLEAIGTLAGGIAHDFNNILFAILGYARLALKGSEEGTPAHRHINKIVVAANCAEDLVGQILAFSRKNEKPSTVVDVAEIIDETLGLMHSSVPETISLLQAMETEKSTIHADPTALHQVVMNLCTNGVHAMEGQEGVVKVTLAYAEIETAEASKDKRLKPGAYVKISISDTGCGMDKALMERIFDPFFTTKEVGKGTGLGLAMVHGIVEDYGGLLLVESEVGKGTCFRIFFPYVQAASHEHPLATEDAGGRLEKILIVDSDEGLVETLRQLLETLGYRVTGTTACEEALEASRAARPAFDLVVTNPTMPDMTGIQLAETVVDLRPEVPVILCTDLARDVLTPQIKDLNIADVIRKPITVEAMGKVIRKVLDAQGALV